MAEPTILQSLICRIRGHRWRFVCIALEGCKVWECRRCGIVRPGVFLTRGTDTRSRQ